MSAPVPSRQLPIRCARRTARFALRAAAFWIAAASALLGAAPAGRAASYEVEVRDQSGAPVENAVVALLRDGVPAPVPTAAPPAATMDQRRKQFAPHVLVVQVGTAVTFPNSDAIRHHVYSFSPAKRFELKLYKGIPAAPVTFDRAGVVVLGCNIHDSMLGYIDVVPTPYFAVTSSQGRAVIEGLPAGKYEPQLWHPRLHGGAPRPLSWVELAESDQRSAPLQLELDADVAREHGHGPVPASEEPPPRGAP